MKLGHILFLLSSYSGALLPLPTMGRPQEVKTVTDGPHAFSSKGGEFTSDSYLGTTISEPITTKVRTYCYVLVI